MKAIAEAWNRFWWSETPLTRLATFRILFCILALFDINYAGAVVLEDAQAMAEGSAEVAWSPMFVFELLGIGPVTPEQAAFIHPLMSICIIACMLGFLTPLSCLLMALLTFYWSCQSYSFEKVHHDKVAYAIAAGMLAISPCGRRLSLDSLFVRWRLAGAGKDPRQVPENSSWAGMTMKVIQVSLALGYSFPGWAKLMDPRWLNGYSLQGIMLGHDNEWAAALTSSLLLSQFMSVGLVTVQATFLLGLFFPRLRWFYIPGAISFHMGTWATMDTGPYITLWFVLVAFLPLERVPGWVVGKLRSGVLWRQLGTLVVVGLPLGIVLYVFAQELPGWMWLLGIPPLLSFVMMLRAGPVLHVIYDGGCGMCSHAAAVMDGLDWAGQLELHDLNQWPEVASKFPQLDEAACIKDMHSVEVGHRTDAGYAAYQRIGWRLPLLAPLAWLLYVPPVPQVGRRVYRKVADGRQTVCRIQT